MAKLFYTLEEAAEKLKRSTHDVQQLIQSGQLQEFRDRDKVMVRIEAVDSLAQDDEELELPLDATGDASGVSLTGFGSSFGMDSGAGDSALAASGAPSTPAEAAIPEAPLDLGDSPPSLPAAPVTEEPLAQGDSSIVDLSGIAKAEADSPQVPEEPLIDLAASASSSGAIGLAASGSSSHDAMEPLSEAEPISLSTGVHSSDLLDAPSSAPINLAESSVDESMASAVAPTVAAETALETIGSGSGLLDLTKESDDTSIGAALLDEVVNAEDGSAAPVAGSGLFAEGTGSGEAAPAPEAVLGSGGGSVGAVGFAPQPTILDGRWSGVGVGALLGAAVALGTALACAAVNAMGGLSPLTPLIASDIWMWTGGAAGATALFAIIGFFVGRAAE